MPAREKKGRSRRRKNDTQYIVIRLSRNTDSDIAEWWNSLPPGANGSALVKAAIRACVWGNDGRRADTGELREMIEALGRQVTDLARQVSQVRTVAPSGNGREIDELPDVDTRLDQAVATERRKQILDRKW